MTKDNKDSIRSISCKLNDAHLALGEISNDESEASNDTLKHRENISDIGKAIGKIEGAIADLVFI